MIVQTAVDTLARYAPGNRLKVITDGGIYEITDIVVSAIQGDVILVGEKVER